MGGVYCVLSVGVCCSFVEICLVGVGLEVENRPEVECALFVGLHTWNVLCLVPCVECEAVSM